MKFLRYILALAALLVSLSAQASSSMFLKMDGIDGDATQANHQKWIDVSNWSWIAVTNSASTNISYEFSLTKSVDSASLKLWSKCAARTVTATAQLDFVRSDVSATYTTFTLGNVYVTSFLVSGSTNDTVFTERIKLRFSSATLKYTPYDAAGVVGSPIAVTLTP